MSSASRWSMKGRKRHRPLALVLALLVGSSGALVVGAPAVSAEPASTAPFTVKTGSLDWGVRTPFRNYIKSPIANGTITESGGVTVNGNGSFHFPGARGAGAGADITAKFSGGVHFVGHEGLLDVAIADPQVVITGSTATLVADVVSVPFTGMDATEPAPPVTYDDVALASLNLAGITPTRSGNQLTYSNIPATMTVDGAPAFGDFIAVGEDLDPVSFTVTTWEPRITVSKTTNVNYAGETVTITGSGFDPSANVGGAGRPPLPGEKTGVYVLFGRFADVWRPSAGAASTARQMISQRWVLPAESRAIVDPLGTNDQYAILSAEGTFSITLELKGDETKTGNYGIATYAAGGAAANATQELFTPISFAGPFPDVPGNHTFVTPIRWLLAENITKGFDDGTFRPALGIERQAVASFLYKLAGKPPVPADAPRFSDVPENHTFYDAISWLAAEGITSGFGDGTFHPGAGIERQALASFLYKMAGKPAVASAPTGFSDVPVGHTFYDAITWMASENITKGFDDGTFRPSLGIERQAVAAFLYRYDAL